MVGVPPLPRIQVLDKPEGLRIHRMTCVFLVIQPCGRSTVSSSLSFVERVQRPRTGYPVSLQVVIALKGLKRCLRVWTEVIVRVKRGCHWRRRSPHPQ